MKYIKLNVPVFSRRINLIYLQGHNLFKSNQWEIYHMGSHGQDDGQMIAMWTILLLTMYKS